MRRTRTLVAAVVLLVAACGSPTEPTTDASPAPSSTATRPDAASSDPVPSPAVAWRLAGGPQRCCFVGYGRSLAAADGTVLVADGYEGSTITALDAASGGVRWEVEVDGSSAFVGDLDGDTAVVHGQYRWLAAIDTSTGVRRWRVDLDEDGYGVAGATLVGDRAVVSTSPPGEGDARAPYVLLVDLADGRTRWRTDLDADTDAQWAPPVVSDGRVLVQTTPDNPGSAATNTLHALDLDSGAVAWRTDLGGRQGFFASPPVVSGDVVVVRGGEGAHGVGLGDGAVRWSAPGAFPLWARPDGGVVLMVRSSLTVVHAADGSHAGTVEVSGPFGPASVPPGVTDERVVVTTRRAVLAFDRATAELRWRHATEATPAALAATDEIAVTMLQDSRLIGLSEEADTAR